MRITNDDTIEIAGSIRTALQERGLDLLIADDLLQEIVHEAAAEVGMVVNHHLKGITDVRYAYDLRGSDR